MNKDELRDKLKRQKGVVDEAEFQHAFDGVDRAIQELKDDGEVVSFKNGKKTYLYYTDPVWGVKVDQGACPPDSFLFRVLHTQAWVHLCFFLSFFVRVFAEFKDLWQNIRVPEDSEIKRELKKSSFKVVEEEVRRIIVSESFSRLLLSHKMFADQTLHPGPKEGQEEEDAEDNKDVQQTP